MKKIPTNPPSQIQEFCRDVSSRTSSGIWCDLDWWESFCTDCQAPVLPSHLTKLAYIYQHWDA